MSNEAPCRYCGHWDAPNDEKTYCLKHYRRTFPDKGCDICELQAQLAELREAASPKLLPLVTGRVVEMGEINTIDTPECEDGSEIASHPMCLVVEFDSIDDIQKAIDSRGCCFTLFGSEEGK